MIVFRTEKEFSHFAVEAPRVTDADDEFDVDVATDPTSAEIISAPDPLIFAEEEQNPPDVDSSSASAEVL